MHKEINQIAQSSIDSMAFSVNKRKHNHPNSHKPPSSGKRNNYFCEHRKISGHSLERCFKIHGYPQSSKFSQDKRFAAHVSVTHASNHEALMNTDNSGFTPAQYNTLLKLLGKKEGTPQTESTQLDESYLTGPFLHLT